MTSREARTRVARGVKLLDKKRPGWFNQVDLSTLRMWSCSCVLFQLGGYSKVAIAIGVNGSGSDEGFMVPDDELIGPENHSWQLLHDAWVKAIMARREPAVIQWTHREAAAV